MHHFGLNNTLAENILIIAAHLQREAFAIFAQLNPDGHILKAKQ